MTFGEVLLNGLAFFWSPGFVFFVWFVAIIGSLILSLFVIDDGWSLWRWAILLVPAVLIYSLVCFCVWMSDVGITPYNWIPEAV